MPKLMFVVTEDWYFASHRLSLALAAQQAGFEVSVITRCRQKARELAPTGLRFVDFQMNRRGKNPLGLLSEILRLGKLLRRERPDLVDLVALRPVVVGGLAAFFARKTRFVFTITGLGYLFTNGREKTTSAQLLLRLISGLLNRGLAVVQNDEDRQVLMAQGLQGERLRLVRGSGINMTQFRPGPEPTGVPIILFPARLLWDKGVGEFVEAAKILRRRRVAARFVLAGETDPHNPASVPREVCQRWREEGDVELWGFQDRMEKVIPLATLVCLPSYREGLPKSLLEAMACGKACITTDSPGCRDAVQHQETGLLVPVKDAPALAEAMASLLADPEARARMGLRGRERAVQDFSEDRVVTQVLSLYRQLLQDPAIAIPEIISETKINKHPSNSSGVQ